MRMSAIALWIPLVLVMTLNTACQRSPTEVWDDSRTAGRHVGNGFRSLAGKGKRGPQVDNASEFAARQPIYEEDKFMALADDDLAHDLRMSDQDMYEQAADSPGEPGSNLPGIDQFTRASDDPQLAGIFKTIHFPYNSDVIEGADKQRTIDAMGKYMKANPKTYIFIEGHCDERGTAAYNLALGSRRANTVRSLLIRAGANADNIFTVSYGKEKPIIAGHEEGTWWQNRRAEFRIHKKG